MKYFRKRYIAFEIYSDKDINIKNFEKSLKRIALDFLGELNYAQARVKILKEFWKNRHGIIMVDHKFVNEIKVCLGLMKEFIVIPKKTFGTLKKIKKEVNIYGNPTT